MKKYIPVLKMTKLFSGIGVEEISAMMNCLQAQLCGYKKGEFVLHQGEHLNKIPVVVEGALHIQCDDYWGNRSITSVVRVGEMLGEAYVAPESGALMNDVFAVPRF